MVRSTAAEALGAIGRAAPAEVVPALAAALRDKGKNADVRAAAAEALGKIGPAAAPTVSALRSVLDDDDEDVRKAAAEAIERIRSAPA